jgi:hypothetical protein
LGAFLVIEGAFDNTSFNAITTAARERGLEETYCRWVRSMLESRLVHTSLMDSSLTARVTGGCPQGGVLSPLLWSLVVDRLLTAANDLGFNTFGYVDDIVIIVQGKFPHTVVQGHAKNHQNSARQDSKNGLSSYHRGYEIDPYCSNGGASGSDSTRSVDHGAGEDGILQAAHT